MTDTHTADKNTAQAATYERLFPEQLANRCSSDAIESNAGPVAYLHALYHQALVLEGSSTSDKRFTLADRRPDLGELLLSKEGLDKEISPLTLAINALSRQAQRHVGQDKRLAEAIGESQYRAGLPYHYPLEQIQAVLRHKQIPLFELLQTTEYTFPNFCYGNLRTDELRQVMRTATGFSPALQALLLDDNKVTAKDYLSKRFGVSGKDQLQQLTSVRIFRQKTGLTPEDVMDLLALEAVDDFIEPEKATENAASGETATDTEKASKTATEGFTSVRRSSAYRPADSAELDGHLYGASFINNGVSPAISLHDVRAQAGIELAFKGASAAHFGRIHKLIHLQRALKLSYAETDLLLMSALRAEGQTADFHITPSTLRVIGVYRYFNEAYRVTAEQFSALIHEVSPYAVGDQVPFLDRVLDGPGAGQLAKIDDSLVIDDSEFSLPSSQDKEGKTSANSLSARLCTAFGTNQQQIEDYLKDATQALGLKKAKLSLPLVSALYRVSRLPRVFRLTMSEGSSLIALLAMNNGSVKSLLAGKGLITDDSGTPDILDVLIGLANVEKWLRTHQLAPSTVLELLNTSSQTSSILLDIETARSKLWEESLPDVSATCLSEQQIKGLMDAHQTLKGDSKHTWMTLLGSYLDKDNGLIKAKLPAEPDLKSALKRLLADELRKADAQTPGNSSPDAEIVAVKIAAALNDARVKQEGLVKHIFSIAFADFLEPQSASSYALPLLKWIGKGPADLLADLLALMPAKQKQQQSAESLDLWRDMLRHTLVIRLTGLSPAGLEALVGHPEWFDLDEKAIFQTSAGETATRKTPDLTLDLLYQLTRYRNWVDQCQPNKFEEKDALDYFENVKAIDDPEAVKSAAAKLAGLIGWSESETLLTVPHIPARQEKTKPGSLDEFISMMTPGELKVYTNANGSFSSGALFSRLHSLAEGDDWWEEYKSTNDKLLNFLEKNKRKLYVTQYQYDDGYKTDEWKKCREDNKQKGRNNSFSGTLNLEVYKPDYEDSKTDQIPITPNTVSDIDFTLRMQAMCKRTGLSCQSLLDLSWQDENASYEEYNNTAQLLLGACNEETQNKINTSLQEPWRDALVDYLMGYWATSSGERQAYVLEPDDLSSYFLTDVSTGTEARKTTVLVQATSSLKHYLFRLYSHLEPGYESSSLVNQTNGNWERYLNQYGTWKSQQAQLNHPENLIYYANRPKKTAAFQELEVEVNQGKLDPELLETAVNNYLNKFERLSNLQVVSGYLDGRDPKNDTYYLVGKTNTTPTEYYWRSVDMGLRDNDQRLSPLAWSEWQKIGLTAGGNIAQSQFIQKDVIQKDSHGNEIKDAQGKTVKKDVTHLSDAVRAVIIAGRPYVFWVERATTPVPHPDVTVQTPTKGYKLSVQYTYLQSDGFWSPANEILCLDGTEDGQWPVKKKGNDTVYVSPEENDLLKYKGFLPGLIVFVNIEGEREVDPWLTVILYKSTVSDIKDIVIDGNCHIEMRDLLLIEKKKLTPKQTTELVATALNSYIDTRKIQHIYNGANLQIKVEHATQTTVEIPQELNTKHIKFSASHINQDTKKANLQIKSNSLEEKYIKTYVFLKTKNGEEHTLLQSGYHINLSVPCDFSGTSFQDFLIARFNDRTDVARNIDPEDPHTSAYFDRYTKENLIKGEYALSTLEDDFLITEHMYRIKVILIPGKSDESWDISIIKTSEQAQYLNLSTVATTPPKFASNQVRLNTVFGKQLVARATQNVERAIEWDTQTLKEPTIDDNFPNPPVDFHGANGIYFRELFLHLPALIATRLTEQQQFEDAEQWYLRYLFDPYRALPDSDGRPAYWNTRPLAEVGSLTSELNKPIDTTARAFILSRYYRQAIFLGLVENWQRQGDHYYRQLTLSSLNHAWLCYQQALKLIGPLPERAEVSRWNPVTLSEATGAHFFMPINQRVIDARKTLENRVYNLRHGLTIDGKAQPQLDWSDESADPFSAAKGALSIVATTYRSDRAEIPAYRFQELVPMARLAAQQLSDLGRHYMALMEEEFNTTLSVLLKSQEIKISDFTLRLKKEGISSIIAKKKGLMLSREAALYRKNFYTDLISNGRNTLEEASAALVWTAGYLNFVTAPLSVAEGAAKAVPRIFGLAVGGMDISGPVTAAKEIIEGTASSSNFIADQLLRESEYGRRAHQWEFDKRLAEIDIELIDQQVAETNIELNAATLSLDESKQERLNLNEAYVAMTTGFTIIPIYNWLVARQELIYGKAYDAVLSMCLGLEAAWRYEIGDYKRDAFIKTSAWSDSYKGMLAGESLLVDLLEMENAFILANERRLTIRKTFSLSKLFSGAIENPKRPSGALQDKAFTPWLDAVIDLSEGKPIRFEFKAEAFDKNYPGQYLRQLRYVTVSFVMEGTTRAEGLCGILTQTGSTTLVDVDKAGVDYLYGDSSDKTKTLPSSIKRNLRYQQAIALSSAVAEDGLGYNAGESVHELAFHEGRYLPFEGTGAISEWELKIPDLDFAKTLVSTLSAAPFVNLNTKDILINVVYTAKQDSQLPTMIEARRKEITEAKANAPAAIAKK